jgi:hypothetical protein
MPADGTWLPFFISGKFGAFRFVGTSRAREAIDPVRKLHGYWIDAYDCRAAFIK